MKILIFAALALAGAAAAGVVAQAGSSRATAIRVTEREYKISLPSTDFTAGAAHFQIKNTGTMPHAFAIAGNGAKAKTKAIMPGKTAVLSITLKKGSYAVWCPMPGHAAKGMKATVVVGTTAQGGGGGGYGGGGGDVTTAPGDTGTDPAVPWG
jgi:plastocyanin